MHNCTGVEYSQEDFLPAIKKPYMRLPSLLAWILGTRTRRLSLIILEKHRRGMVEGEKHQAKR